MFVTEYADTFAAFPGRRVEQGRNAKRFKVRFCQVARGRVRQNLVGNDRPSGCQLVKIGPVLHENNLAVFELLIKTICVTQIQDFTRNC